MLLSIFSFLEVQAYKIHSIHSQSSSQGITSWRLAYANVYLSNFSSLVPKSLTLFYPGIELPRINYDYNGKKYKYVYVTEVKWSPVPTKV